MLTLKPPTGRIKILPVLLYLFICFSVHSQSDIDNKLWFNSLQGYSNFTSSYNHFIYHDSEGFVWISSTAGLNRFDGVRVKHYHSVYGDSTSLFDDNIQSTFFEDTKKNIWFSTGHAVHSYQRETDDFLHHVIKINNGETKPEDYRVFFLERDSFLWFRANNGIFRYNIHQPQSSATFIDTTNAYRCLVDTTTDGSVQYLYGMGLL